MKDVYPEHSGDDWVVYKLSMTLSTNDGTPPRWVNRVTEVTLWQQRN